MDPALLSNINPLASFDFFQYLSFGSLFIAAIVVTFAFIIIWKDVNSGVRSSSDDNRDTVLNKNHKVSNRRVLYFMVFGFAMYLVSILSDPQSPLMQIVRSIVEKSAPTPVPTAKPVIPQESKILSALKAWDSNWIPVAASKTYNITHNLHKYPIAATIWYREAGSNKVHVMDGIYAFNPNGGSAGYGSWLMDVTQNSFTLSTGSASPTSGYGVYNHWDAIDGEDAVAGDDMKPREVRVVLLFAE